MAEAHDELAMPHFEDELWAQLADAYAAQPAGRRNGTGRWPGRARPGRDGRRRGRRPIVLAVAGLAAATVLVVVAVAWPEGEGATPPERVETINVPEPAIVVDRVLQAMEPGEDELAVVHQTTTWGEEEEEGIDRIEVWYDEVTFARRQLNTTADGEPLVDSGWPEPPALDAAPAPREPEVTGFDQCVGGLAMDEEGNVYSCETGEPVDTGLPPGHPQIVVNHCAQSWFETEGPLMQEYGFGYLQLYLETGDIVVDGTAEHDGRQLIRLRNHDASFEYLVDPETYEPVVAIEQTTGTPRKTTEYERLARTEDNLELLTPALPDGYDESTGEEIMDDAVEHPCQERPESEAEPVPPTGVTVPHDAEVRLCEGFDYDGIADVGHEDQLDELLGDVIDSLDPEALEQGVLLDCDGDGETEMDLGPEMLTPTQDLTSD